MSLSPDAARALARLRDPDGAALRALARLVVDGTTAAPLRDLAPASWIAGQLAAALEAATRGTDLRDAVEHRLDQGRQRWAHEPRPLRELIPAEVLPPLRRLVTKPWSPSPALAHRVVRQPAVRDLMADVLEDAISRFGRRLRATDDGLLGGLGRKAAQRGRAFGKGLLAAAGVADVASDLAHAVTEEFEAALERRVREFVGDATARALDTVVTRLSDPAQQAANASFREAIFEELLGTPVRELVAEAEGLGPLDALDVVIQAVKVEIARENFVDRLTGKVQQVLDEAGDGTLGAWLDEVGLRGVWVDASTELVARRLGAVVHTEPFAAWWTDLFSE
jgi:hypothetical protein